DDTVAATHHKRIGAMLQSLVEQLTRVIRIPADDFAHVDAALLKPCDRPLGRMLCVAVTRQRVRQDGDAADLAVSSHGCFLRLETLDLSRGIKPVARAPGVLGPGMSVVVVTVRICRGFDCCQLPSRRKCCRRTVGMRGMCGIWRWRSNSI